MAPLGHVSVGPLEPRRFSSELTAEEYQALLELIDRAARELHGRVVWNVNSTAQGGGVAELLRPLLGYARGSGVDGRWVVISGGSEFFHLTKRIHNNLHGFGDRVGVTDMERSLYEETLGENASELVDLISHRDIVILHDPQTAGLVPAVSETGATVIWRCHVGLDKANKFARAAWDFLRPYVLPAQAYVFSRAAFAWEGLPPEKLAVIQPSIDAFSPKNAYQAPEKVLAILARSGILSHQTRRRPTFTRFDGSPGRVDRRVEMLEISPLNKGDRLLTQISRWDRLKDPVGVLSAFVQHIADRSDAHLLLAGPEMGSVSDDPEAVSTFWDVRRAWEGLPATVQRRVHLALLPMEDADENAAIVNALQRHSEVISQKSLAEGFGLTVAEAMWKERPVVASWIGGVQEQIIDGESGLLISNPRDLAEFGSAVLALLGDRERARAIGIAARERVRQHFLGPFHLARYFELFRRLMVSAEGTGREQAAAAEAPPG